MNLSIKCCMEKHMEQVKLFYYGFPFLLELKSLEKSNFLHGRVLMFPVQVKFLIERSLHHCCGIFFEASISCYKSVFRAICNIWTSPIVIPFNYRVLQPKINFPNSMSTKKQSRHPGFTQNSRDFADVVCHYFNK